ncbi:Uncharacterised protein [Sphingobacterium multivorum]|nr:Uncharacterised protein [Sphingobacterium multivorum]
MEFSIKHGDCKRIQPVTNKLKRIMNLKNFILNRIVLMEFNGKYISYFIIGVVVINRF